MIFAIKNNDGNWIEDIPKTPAGAHLTGTEGAECIQGGPGHWEDFEKLCLTIDITGNFEIFFPSNTHAKLMKFSAVTLKISSGFFAFLLFFS